METSMVKVQNPKSMSTALNNYRFERKFVFENTDLDWIINSIVLTHPNIFKEVYHRRTINNIYFDDCNHSFYKMNVSGVGERSKYRLRWYNDNYSELAASTLEIKKKLGEVGDKLLYKLADFELNLENRSSDDINSLIQNQIKDQALLSKFQLLSPLLYNSYERRYFLSEDEKFRITLDYNMKFFNPNVDQFELTEVAIEDIILELKYNTEDDKEGRTVSQTLGSRLSKNSKYVRGYDLLYWQ